MSTLSKNRGALSRSAIALAVALGLAETGTALARSPCAAAADRIAARHALAIDLPDLAPENPEAGSGEAAPDPEALARSGGVIAPPQVDDPAVIEPPPGVTYGMPTLVDPSPGAAPGMMTPADRAVLASLLTAARAEAEGGDEPGCRARLDEAEAFLSGKAG